MNFILWKNVLEIVVSIVEVILNTLAVITVIYYVVIGFINQYKGTETAKKSIWKGISIALNYNLVTETLKIIVGREGKDLIIIGAILLLKLLITSLFILEMKQEEMHNKIEIQKKEIKNGKEYKREKKEKVKNMR